MKKTEIIARIRKATTSENTTDGYRSFVSVQSALNHIPASVWQELVEKVSFDELKNLIELNMFDTKTSHHAKLIDNHIEVFYKGALAVRRLREARFQQLKAKSQSDGR